MSQTQTQVVSTDKSHPKLDLAQLKTVKWIGSVGLVQQGVETTSVKYNSAKCNSKFIAYILAPIEFVVISFYLFIHQLPWPTWFMEILFKVDRIIEGILEAVGDKVEWWCDILMVRLMWFRDSVEAFIDGVLTFILYIVYQVLNFFSAIVDLTFRFWKWVFAPLFWIVNQIWPKEKTSNQVNSVSSNGVSEMSSPLSSRKSKSRDSNVNDYVDLSSKSSDYESDVSAVSESWSLGHTDKSGKSYNRVDVKVRAEGRLRAAMYKRVKGQLSLMRKNSISFSKGMTTYARKFLEPKVTPLLTSIKNWILQTAVQYNLLDSYEKISLWINEHPIIERFLSLNVQLMMVPLNFVHKLLSHDKRKSRRTRSMRSESLRRRTGNVTCDVTPPAHEPYGLSQSAEPLVEEEYVTLRKVHESSLKEEHEEDTMRDSALASSIDDICHASDSCESPSQTLKEQTIVEETKGETTTAEENRALDSSSTNDEQSNSLKSEGSSTNSANGSEFQNKNENPLSILSLEKTKRSLSTLSSFANVTKTSSEENIYNKNQKSPKRKISFSLS